MERLKELYWLAGILEGEGAFLIRPEKGRKNWVGSPIIRCQMVDRDIIERIANLFKAKVNGPYGPYKENKQPYYSTQVFGKKAVGIMFTLFPLLGMRRRNKIKEIINKWKNYTPDLSTRFQEKERNIVS